MAFGSALAAVLFGVRGIEVASWLAGVGGLVVAVATLVIALPASGDVNRQPGQQRDPSVQATGGRSIAAGGDMSGIASTGDQSTQSQRW